jgi:hypothetical protein
MSIRGGQGEPPEALELWMAEHRRHEPLAMALAAMGRHYEHIDQVGECGVIRDDPGERYLVCSEDPPEAQRVLDGALDELARDSSRPVRLFTQETVDEIPVEFRSIGRDP